MKKLMLILLLVVCNTMHAQEWITDDDIDVKISGKNAYGESYAVVVAEFYASFNKDNEFKDWDLLEGVKYYKCDIKKAPQAKKNYKVRMAPTIIIYLEGILHEDYRAGLDLVCPVNLVELQEEIDKINKY